LKTGVLPSELNDEPQAIFYDFWEKKEKEIDQSAVEFVT